MINRTKYTTLIHSKVRPSTPLEVDSIEHLPCSFQEGSKPAISLGSHLVATAAGLSLSTAQPMLSNASVHLTVLASLPSMAEEVVLDKVGKRCHFPF